MKHDNRRTIRIQRSLSTSCNDNDDDDDDNDWHGHWKTKHYSLWPRKPVCDFLLVINSNWHPISYIPFRTYRSLLFKFRTLRFSHPLGGLGTTYDVYLKLIGKCVVDFLLVLIEVFFTRCYGWVATSEEIENRRFRSNAVNVIQNFR